MQGWYTPQDTASADPEEAIRHLLTDLLVKGIVDGLLVPLRTPDGRNTVPTLVHDPVLLAQAAPLAPVLPVNAGTVLGHITIQRSGSPSDLGRVGAVLRNCELRTAVELS